MFDGLKKRCFAVIIHAKRDLHNGEASFLRIVIDSENTRPMIIAYFIRTDLVPLGWRSYSVADPRVHPRWYIYELQYHGTARDVFPNAPPILQTTFRFILTHPAPLATILLWMTQVPQRGRISVAQVTATRKTLHLLLLELL